MAQAEQKMRQISHEEATAVFAGLTPEPLEYQRGGHTPRREISEWTIGEMVEELARQRDIKRAAISLAEAVQGRTIRIARRDLPPQQWAIVARCIEIEQEIIDEMNARTRKER